MSPWIILFSLLGYFGLLIFIARITGGKADNASFFLGNRQSPWYVVAFGMIGASLSGVTFISVPGWVGVSQFSYMQMVLGFIPGYLVVAFVLLPLYYRLQLTSIYTYLRDRFGERSYKTGASFFLISRVIGAALRLYLVATVLQLAVFDKLDIQIPFGVTVIITVLLIWLYTYRGGIKTIIWTDTLQTAFMLFAVVVAIYSIGQALNLDLSGLISTIDESPMSKTFFFEDSNDKKYFFKQFFAGMFTAIAMTGLDQDMMQKNLSCRNLRDAQKNMLSFTAVLVFVNLMFLSLGVLLYVFASAQGIAIPEKTDELFPMLAVEGYLGASVGLLFVIGLIAAAYSSADSALTALTTSFSIDILGVDQMEESRATRIRKRVHMGISVVLMLVIFVFYLVNDKSVISQIYTVAGYTYGPLLGLFAFGLFSKRPLTDRFVPFIAIASPLICFGLSRYSKELFGGYEFGFELLIINGAITYGGLWLNAILSKR